MNASSNNTAALLVTLRKRASSATNAEPLAAYQSARRMAVSDASIALWSTPSYNERTNRKADRNGVAKEHLAGVAQIPAAGGAHRESPNSAEAGAGRAMSTKSAAGNAVAHTGREAQAGERDRRRRFEALLAAHLEDLYRFAYWLSGDRSVAEDVVQEALIRAWKSIDQLNDDKVAKHWLLTIVRRENARHYGRAPFQQADLDADKLVAQRRDYDTSTEAFVLRGALDRLPPKYREPLLMQVIYGYSQREIAEHLGISDAGAGTRLFRAREKMRALL